MNSFEVRSTITHLYILLSKMIQPHKKLLFICGVTSNRWSPLICVCNFVYVYLFFLSIFYFFNERGELSAQLSSYFQRSIFFFYCNMMLQQIPQLTDLHSRDEMITNNVVVKQIPNLKLIKFHLRILIYNHGNTK